MTSLHAPSCSECGQTFKGRADKKFCSDHCRSIFNNRQRRVDNDYVNLVNKVLKRNRQILSTINPTGKVRVTREILLSKGFDFNFFTNVYRTREGSQYFYCYDHGYLPLEKDQYLLVVKK